jgi:glucosamine-6-phosphate deaminase
VTLASESIVNNGLYWGGDQHVPRQAVTAGMNLLLAAKKIMLVVSGEKKASHPQADVERSRHVGCPASFLQQAPNVTIFIDQDAYRI